MLGALHVLSPVLLISPEDFAYRLALVLAGGDEQLASQPRPQEGTVDKVIVKKHADIGKVVLDVPPRQSLRERRNARMVFKGQAIFFLFNDNDTEKNITSHGFGSSASCGDQEKSFFTGFDYLGSARGCPLARMWQ